MTAAAAAAGAQAEQDKWGRPLVPCKWCCTPTAMTGTKMCDGCWELDHRISGNPELARRILAAYDAERAR